MKEEKEWTDKYFIKKCCQKAKEEVIEIAKPFFEDCQEWELFLKKLQGEK